MSDAVFGDVVTMVDVEKAVTKTLQKWMPLYLRFFERRNGFKPLDYEDIKSWRAADTMEDRFPEQQIPAVQVMLTSDDTMHTSGESAQAVCQGTIDVLVQSVEPEPARELAHYYSFAIGMALSQHEELDGTINLGGKLAWEKLGVPAVGKPQGGRWLALGSVEIALYVLNLFDPGAGPFHPPTPEEEKGQTEPPDRPTVSEHHITLIPED